MKTKKILFYILSGILGGCVPIMSLHPLFSEKDVVFDEKLLGVWIEDSNTSETIWEFTRPDANENAYRLIFSDKEGKKGSFDAHLTKLQNKLFLDIYPSEPPWDEADPNKVKWPYNTLFLIPAHTFIKIDSIDLNLTMRLTDDEKMDKLFEQDPNAVEHTSVDNKPVLTATTKELQAFVLKYADDNRLFTNETILSRQKTKGPDEPLVSEPNEAKRKVDKR